MFTTSRCLGFSSDEAMTLLGAIERIGPARVNWQQIEVRGHPPNLPFLSKDGCSLLISTLIQRYA